ncbi:MAG: hypothetical protein QE280_03580 [Caulobacter sp.]|nr:hypothetical protein [Caulobacter sp.]
MMSSDRGSIFIETLISAAIVAGVMGVSYRVIADSVSRSSMVESRRMALLIAQSRLAEAGDSRPVQPGSTSGSQPPFVWRTVIERQPGGLAGSAAGDLALVTVSVRLEDSDRNLATLRTLRLTGGSPP